MLLVLGFCAQAAWAEPLADASQKETTAEASQEEYSTDASQEEYSPEVSQEAESKTSDELMADEQTQQKQTNEQDQQDDHDQTAPSEAVASETKAADEPVRDAQGRILTEEDLGFWFRGIDEKAYAEKLRMAVETTPTTGVGYCASWVSYVYQAAGLGFVGGNACDMWQFCCTSTDANAIHEGMIIAVRHSSASQLGMIYGHCGILLRNPAYQGSDQQGQAAQLQKEKENLEAQLSAARESGDRKELSTLLQSMKDLEDESEGIEETVPDGDQFFEVKGRMIQTDSNGNEKWLVADSTTHVGISSLSSWISSFDFADTAAWGWGHAFSGRVAVWEGDIPSLVPFLFHDSNQGLKEVYGIDFDNLSDDDAYWVVCSVCASAEGLPGAITLDGGAVVDSTKYYELLGHMTAEQSMRWESILTRYRQEAEERARAEEEARLAAEEAKRQEEEAQRAAEEAKLQEEEAQRAAEEAQNQAETAAAETEGQTAETATQGTPSQGQAAETATQAASTQGSSTQGTSTQGSAAQGTSSQRAADQSSSAQGAGTKPAAQPQTQAETQPQTQAETQPQTQAETQPQTQAETQPQTQAETQPQTQAETQPQTQPETQPETQPQTPAETQPETPAEIESPANPEEPVSPVSEDPSTGGSEVPAVTEPEIETEPVYIPETETQPEYVPEPVVIPETEPVVIQEPEVIPEEAVMTEPEAAIMPEAVEQPVVPESVME